MADGVGYPPGAGLKIATREVPYSDEAMQVQVVGLVTFSGVNDAKVAADVGADNPLPVSAPSLGAPTDAEAAGDGSIIGLLKRLRTLMDGVLTDAQLRASAVPVSGPVTDAQLRASAVPVSGPVTDAQLRASAVPVSGPVTDAQLRASAVPVSGPVTDAQLRESPLQVSDEDVARLLVRVIALLGAPVNYDPSLNRERVTAIVESGTVAVSTLPTLPGITNFGSSREATELQNNQAIAVWAACHAARVF